VVEAFLAASRGGDLDALVALLDPDVVLRLESGVAPPGGTREYRGASTAAEEAIRGAQRAARTVPVRVNGAAGLVALDAQGRPFALLCFAIAGGRIVALDVLADPARIGRLDLQRFAASGP
jgi:RNA polymerase sigma-70 factor (ECF subfamily)